ncbi:MAG TPA: hypothetical protein VGM09_13635, partial [Bradyrhizobium sp.]
SSARKKARDDAAASIASRPALRDDREPPLQWDETATDMRVICREIKVRNFSRRDWTEFC